MRVAVVIPAWNEAESLGALLEEIETLPAGTVEWTIVVDANSTDDTTAVARRHGAQVVTQRRRGYGAACFEGFRTAQRQGATHVAFMDGDGSDPPPALPGLLGPLQRGEADLVLGVRQAATGAADPIPWHARAGNALVCALLRQRTGGRVSDLPSMKVLSVERLAALDMTEMGFGWTTEMIAKALRRGYRVQETPVPVRRRIAGVSKVSGNWRNSARAGASLLRAAMRATR
jgi:glycosyltransferase involved in cell wall biosynthesis